MQQLAFLLRPTSTMVAAVLILGGALVTGSVRLLLEIVLLPFRLLGALAHGNRKAR